MISTRKKLSFGGVLATGVLATASAAFACIPFAGTLKVTPPAGHGVASDTVVGDGTTASKTYCTVPANGAAVQQATALPGAVVSVVVAASTSAQCTNTSKLPQGDGVVGTNYEVRFVHDTTAYPFKLVSGRWQVALNKGCFINGTGPSGTTTLDTAYSVDSAGAGSKSVTLPSVSDDVPTSGVSELCVGKAGGTGIFVPVQINSGL